MERNWSNDDAHNNDQIHPSKRTIHGKQKGKRNDLFLKPSELTRRQQESCKERSAVIYDLISQRSPMNLIEDLKADDECYLWFIDCRINKYECPILSACLLNNLDAADLLFDEMKENLEYYEVEQLLYRGNEPMPFSLVGDLMKIRDVTGDRFRSTENALRFMLSRTRYGVNSLFVNPNETSPITVCTYADMNGSGSFYKNVMVERIGCPTIVTQNKFSGSPREDSHPKKAKNDTQQDVIPDFEEILWTNPLRLTSDQRSQCAERAEYCLGKITRKNDRKWMDDLMSSKMCFLWLIDGRFNTDNDLLLVSLLLGEFRKADLLVDALLKYGLYEESSEILYHGSVPIPFMLIAGLRTSKVKNSKNYPKFLAAIEHLVRYMEHGMQTLFEDPTTNRPVPVCLYAHGMCDRELYDDLFVFRYGCPEYTTPQAPRRQRWWSRTISTRLFRRHSSYSADTLSHMEDSSASDKDKS